MKDLMAEPRVLPYTVVLVGHSLKKGACKLYERPHGYILVDTDDLSRTHVSKPAAETSYMAEVKMSLGEPQRGTGKKAAI